MNTLDHTEVDRRTFVRSTLVAAVVGMTCLREGLAEALAEARLTDKPVLTENAMNRLFAQSKAKGQLPKLAAQISKDIKGWLMSNFSLTKIQQDAISSFTRDQIEQLQKVLKFVEATGPKATLTVSFTTEPDSAKHHGAHAVPWRCRAHAEARDNNGHKVEADASASSSSY
jgi:D-alanyl-D-alanine dipeptidase